MSKKIVMIECFCCEKRFIAIPLDRVLDNALDEEIVEKKIKIETNGTKGEKVEFFYCDDCIKNNFIRK